MKGINDEVDRKEHKQASNQTIKQQPPPPGLMNLSDVQVYLLDHLDMVDHHLFYYDIVHLVAFSMFLLMFGF